MAVDLNFAVCVSFREDKAKTKQLRFFQLLYDIDFTRAKQ